MKAIHRWLAIAVSVAMLGLIIYCCGLAGRMYVGLLSHVESYKATNSPTLDGYPVKLRVHPETRQGKRLLGPPYAFDFSIRGPVTGLSQGRLLAACVIRDDGSTIEAEVNQPEREPGDDGSLALFGRFRQGNWGKTPKLVAQIELVYAERTVCEEMTFTLEWHRDSSIYIP